MNEETTEQNGVEESQGAPVIDVDEIAAKITENLQKSQPQKEETHVHQPQKEENWDDLDYDQQNARLRDNQSKMAQDIENVRVQGAAFTRISATADIVMQSVPEEYRESAKSYVQDEVARLASESPQMVAAGLPDQLKGYLVDMAIGRAVREGKAPVNEPKGEPSYKNIPYASEIIEAFKEGYGRMPSQAEIEERSKTWGGTRAR